MCRPGSAFGSDMLNRGADLDVGRAENWRQ